MSSQSSSHNYFHKLKATIDSMDMVEVDHCIDIVREGFEAGRQVITFGNGGSAVTALHFITDWSKMVFAHTRRPFRGRTLLDNIGIITAYANDVSYADVFAEQMRHTAEPGDVVIAISGSGNSENIIRAVAYANEIGCETIGLCGFNGGRLRRIAKHVIWANIDDMQIAEDIHAVFGHIVMQVMCGGIKQTSPRVKEAF